jgi:hypothetical protein
MPEINYGVLRIVEPQRQREGCRKDRSNRLLAIR